MIEITLEEQGRRILQREKELGLNGPMPIPVNDGSRRTEAKRETLRTLRAMGSPFQANIGDPPSR
jgi:hypothetical protein